MTDDSELINIYLNFVRDRPCRVDVLLDVMYYILRYLIFFK